MWRSWIVVLSLYYKRIITTFFWLIRLGLTKCHTCSLLLSGSGKAYFQVLSHPLLLIIFHARVISFSVHVLHHSSVCLQAYLRFLFFCYISTSSGEKRLLQNCSSSGSGNDQSTVGILFKIT